MGVWVGGVPGVEAEGVRLRVTGRGARGSRSQALHTTHYSTTREQDTSILRYLS
jgi:hypothetical protein